MQSLAQQYWAQHPALEARARAEGVDVRSPHLPIRAVLFDMDGVLFDSMPGHAKAWAQVCQARGLQLNEIDAYMNEGRTAFTTIEWVMQRQFGRGTTEAEVEEIYRHKAEVFNTFPEAPKMEGAESLLSQVQADGLEMVVVTGSGQASLLNRLTTHYPSYFTTDRIVSSIEVAHGKPHPEPYLMGLQRAGNLRPWEAIVVENAPLGVRSAVAAEIFTIAVNTGPLPECALTDEGCNLLLPSMPEFAAQWSALRAQLF
ncbi:MAG: HAD hydrolase-like protein [Bacteroidaceae bacterium]|nr:HAD hydrolase-like protein [Bacteroidaceae bacterium]